MVKRFLWRRIKTTRTARFPPRAGDNVSMSEAPKNKCEMNAHKSTINQTCTGLTWQHNGHTKSLTRHLNRQETHTQHKLSCLWCWASQFCVCVCVFIFFFCVWLHRRAKFSIYLFLGNAVDGRKQTKRETIFGVCALMPTTTVDVLCERFAASRPLLSGNARNSFPPNILKRTNIQNFMCVDTERIERRRFAWLAAVWCGDFHEISFFSSASTGKYILHLWCAASTAKRDGRWMGWGIELISKDENNTRDKLITVFDEKSQLFSIDFCQTRQHATMLCGFCARPPCHRHPNSA